MTFRRELVANLLVINLLENRSNLRMKILCILVSDAELHTRSRLKGQY